MARLMQLLEGQQGNKSVPRTCEELHAFDPFKASGLYQIDPDGAFVGDPPITVYCDMSTGNPQLLE